MSNVTQIKACANVPTALRNIANAVEAGNLPDDSCTLVLGSEVFHLGCVDDQKAAGDAIFNLTFGIQKLMRPVVDESFDT